MEQISINYPVHIESEVKTIPVLTKTYCHEDINDLMEDLNEELNYIDDDYLGILKGEIKVEISYITRTG